MHTKTYSPAPMWAGTFATALRWVIGWTYFSAFWRRVILENKLDPEVAGYIGEKFNHFLPNALFIKPLIEHLVSNPNELHWAMILFTIVEAIVGFFLIIGLATRLMGFGVFSLAMGILLGSGWIGTTCLDEWQIGVLGVASGFLLMLSGSGNYSVDNFLIKRSHGKLTDKKWFRLFFSGELRTNSRRLNMISLSGAVIIFGLTLFTNQVFHNGVWGKLHNKSVKPIVEINNIKHKDDNITFDLFRIEGADVYGSFLIGIKITDRDQNVLYELKGDDLALFDKNQIRNQYVAKIKPGKHSLVIPLGAKANITLEDEVFSHIKGQKNTLILTDVSGIEWKAEF